MLKIRQLDNLLRMKIDGLQKKIATINYLNPKELLTENRKDIYYRYLFLRDIFEKGLSPVKTLYFHFISDANRGVVCNGETMSNNFIKLYKNIKKNGIKKKILVGKYNSNFIKSRYMCNEMKYLGNIKNETGYQLIEGAHRLAIALYLGYDKIPCKIYKPLSFEVPNYTQYIKLHEEIYMKLIENPGLQRLHKKIKEELYGSKQNFGRGSFYQGLDIIGIKGQRPTKERFEIYALGKYLSRDDRVLDIGSNCGFFSLYVAKFVKSVEGIERDLSLINIGNEVKKYLKITNCTFHNSPFETYPFNHKYDVILSFAVHHWLDYSFEEYLNNLKKILEKNGRLILESQDIKNVDKNFVKNVRHFVEEKSFIIENEGDIKDDGIIQRKFFILRKIG